MSDQLQALPVALVTLLIFGLITAFFWIITLSAKEEEDTSLFAPNGGEIIEDEDAEWQSRLPEYQRKELQERKGRPLL